MPDLSVPLPQLQSADHSQPKTHRWCTLRLLSKAIHAWWRHSRRPLRYARRSSRWTPTSRGICGLTPARSRSSAMCLDASTALRWRVSVRCHGSSSPNVVFCGQAISRCTCARITTKSRRKRVRTVLSRLLPNDACASTKRTTERTPWCTSVRRPAASTRALPRTIWRSTSAFIAAWSRTSRCCVPAVLDAVLRRCKYCPYASRQSSNVTVHSQKVHKVGRLATHSKRPGRRKRGFIGQEVRGSRDVLNRDGFLLQTPPPPQDAQSPVEKTHKCETCSCSFAQPDSLASHMRQHRKQQQKLIQSSGQAHPPQPQYDVTRLTSGAQIMQSAMREIMSSQAEQLGPQKVIGLLQNPGCRFQFLLE